MGLVANATRCELAQSAILEGQGVYLLIYRGEFAPYSLISKVNGQSQHPFPVYVGKAWALDKSRRKRAAAERTVRHRRSIELVSNLETDDFEVLFIKLPLAKVETTERMLIDLYKPLWNVALPGFGNKHPGAGRDRQKKSRFDVLHPGRTYADMLPPSAISVDHLREVVDGHIEQWLTTVVRRIDPAVIPNLTAELGSVGKMRRTRRSWSPEDFKEVELGGGVCAPKGRQSANASSSL